MTLETSVEQYPSQRRYPRAPLKTPVEVWAGQQNLFGETENVSAGGMLLRCQQVFEPGTQLNVLFNLAAGFSIKTACAVVHTLPKARMGLEFLELSHGSRAELNDFVIELLSYERRGARIAKKLTITLRSLQAEQSHEEMAETIMLSQYGGLLACRANFQNGENVYLRWPGGKRGAKAQIAYKRPAGSGLNELGFEFKEEENFWGLDFRQDS